MSEEDGAEKSFDPTPEKLRKAREEGQVPKSNDLNTAAAYLAFFAIAMTVGGASVTKFAQEMMGVLARADTLSEQMFDYSAQPGMGSVLSKSVLSLIPWFTIPALFVILSLIAQQAFVISPKKLQPKLNKISLISNAKNKFGRNGLFEFGKSAFKLIVYCIIAYLFLRGRINEIIGALYFPPAPVAYEMVALSRGLLLSVFLVAVVIGGVDFFWQKAEHHRKNMMTRKEVQDEHKNTEGDPEFKQKRRQKGQQIALNQMLADVPEADVIIVNPTHYAVALKWDRASTEPPVCVAKGVDEIAARIREIANENEIPIHSDPPVARALHASIDIGDPIPFEHFKAVAAAIRFADEMRRRAKFL